MKSSGPDSARGADTPTVLKRRGVLLGAGVAAGTAAAAVVAARGGGLLPDAPAAAAQARAEDDTAGYRLSEHVRRYYETART